MAIPIPAEHGRVVGTFVVATGDGADTNLLPDYVPVTGTITFTANANSIRVVNASPKPVTVLPAKIVCGIDSDGDLCYPVPGVGVETNKFVHLIATDDAALNPTDWTYTVDFQLAANGSLVHYAAFDVKVPANGVIDLTVVAPVELSSTGIQITKGDTGAQGLPGTIALIKGVVASPDALPVDAVEGDAYVVEGGDLYSFISGAFVRVANIVGKSAYQSWLDDGYVGTENDFIQHLTGSDGVDGVDGTNGIDGKSAYEIWTEAGNVGTIAQFLTSIRGADGTNGTNGTNGKSAYQSWLNVGNAGTEAEFVAYITGTDGQSAYALWLALGNTGTEQEFLDSFHGKDVYQLWLENDNAGTEQDFLLQLNGTDGESAYEVWLASGYTGTQQDFITFITGTDGKSAYQSALDNGFVGTEAEWLTSINGADAVDGIDGTNGVDGVDGKSAYEVAVTNGFVGTEAEWLVSLNGADGVDGVDGTNGVDGVDGKSAYEVAVTNGFVGTEADWLVSLNGADGVDGVDGTNGVDSTVAGPDGKSAYEIAVTSGFVGTESEWLLSLKGEDGAASTVAGADGSDGASAYEIAVTNGFVGTESEWLLSLNGADGVDGVDGADSTVAGPDGKSAYQVAVINGFVGTEAEWLTSLNGTDGVNGSAGPAGPSGLETISLGSLTSPAYTDVSPAGRVAKQTAAVVVDVGMRLTAVTFRSLEAGSYEFWINGGKFGSQIVTLANTDATFVGRRFLDGQMQHDFELRMIGATKRIRYFTQVQTFHSAYHEGNQAASFWVGMQQFPAAGAVTPAWSFQIEALPTLKTLLDVNEAAPDLGQVLGYTGGGMWGPIDTTAPLITSLVRTDDTVPESLNTWSDGTFQHIDLSLHTPSAGGGGEQTTGWWTFSLYSPAGDDIYNVRRTGNIVEWVLTASVNRWTSHSVDTVACMPGITPSGVLNAHSFVAAQIDQIDLYDPNVEMPEKNYGVVIGASESGPGAGLDSMNIKRVNRQFVPGSSDFVSEQFSATCFYLTNDEFPPEGMFPIALAQPGIGVPAGPPPGP